MGTSYLTSDYLPSYLPTHQVQLDEYEAPIRQNQPGGHLIKLGT